MVRGERAVERERGDARRRRPRGDLGSAGDLRRAADEGVGVPGRGRESRNASSGVSSAELGT